MPPAEGMCLAAGLGGRVGQRGAPGWAGAAVPSGRCHAGSLCVLMPAPSQVAGHCAGPEQEGTSWEGGMWDLVCRTSERWLGLAA